MCLLPSEVFSTQNKWIIKLMLRYSEKKVFPLFIAVAIDKLKNS